MVRNRLIVGAFVTLLAAVAIVPRAAAAEGSADTAPAAPAEAPPAIPPSPSPSPVPPAQSSPSPAGPDSSSADATTSSAGVPMVAATTQAAPGARYGVGARFRATSVPKWLLGLFLDESVPLSSYTGGVEFFRRSGNFDLVLGVAYQNLSPKDGNWLGHGNPPDIDTDFVQFRNLGSYSVDAALILHTEFNEYVGIHYGGGVGIGIISGKMLKTSNGSPGCLDNPGDPALCHPVIPSCDVGPCTEGQLRTTEGGGFDGPTSPVRTVDKRVPAAYPIINLVTGLDVRLPSVPGLAVKIDLGYFLPYFFLGGSVAYQI